jgi:DNA polymerase III subunit chi
VSEGGEIWFYHLERSSVEETLPPLLEKCVERGWRSLVRTISGERLEAIDKWLWTYRPNAWIPHAPVSGDPKQDDRQSILLEAGTSVQGDAFPALFLLEGADWAGIDNVARIFVLFDGRDEDAVSRARDDWRRAKASGLTPAYWRQSEAGKWART